VGGGIGFLWNLRIFRVSQFFGSRERQYRSERDSIRALVLIENLVKSSKSFSWDLETGGS